MQGPKPNPTLTDSAQFERWKLFLACWKTAAKDNMCTLIGDTHFDFFKCQNPDQSHFRMVEMTTEEMETEDFTQMINGVTRTWRGQTDSLLDKCWVNKPKRIIIYTNEVRLSSYYNFINVLIKTKDKCPQYRTSRKGHRGICVY